MPEKRMTLVDRAALQKAQFHLRERDLRWVGIYEMQVRNTADTRQRSRRATARGDHDYIGCAAKLLDDLDVLKWILPHLREAKRELHRLS
jgi:hypothetical protein